MNNKYIDKLNNLYQNSFLFFLITFLLKQWQESVIVKSGCKFLDKEPWYKKSCTWSVLNRLFDFFSHGAECINKKINQSILGGIYEAFLKKASQSLILGEVFSGGIKKILLFIIGGYVLLDYFLRDVVSIPIFSTVWDELLLLICAAWLILDTLRGKKYIKLGTNPLDLPILTFFAVSLILLMLVNSNLSVNILGMRVTLQYILWFFIVTRLIANEDNFKMLYWEMTLIAAVIGCYGVWQYIVGVPMPSDWVDAAEESVRTRVFAIFSSCNIMGDYMVMFAPLAAGLAYSLKDMRLKLFAWFCTFVMCIACLFTMSRGAWVALIVAIIVFAFLVDMKLIALMLVGGCLSLFVPFVQSRISFMLSKAYRTSAAKAGRSVRWKQAIGYLFERKPILGMGFGMFGGAVAMLNQPLAKLEYFYTDNYYIKILSENGILGLTFFALMMLCVVFVSVKGWYRVKKHRPDLAPLSGGCTAGICGVLVHCYFENIFEEPYMAACFWILVAMNVYLGYISKEK